MRANWLAGFVIAAAVLTCPTAASAATTASVVSPKMPLNVRSGPAVWNSRVRTLPNGSPVSIDCQVKGQRIGAGTTRITDMWDRLTDGSYVSDAWISRAGDVPACGAVPVVAAQAAPAATVASGSIPL